MSGQLVSISQWLLSLHDQWNSVDNREDLHVHTKAEPQGAPNPLPSLDVVKCGDDHQANKGV